MTAATSTPGRPALQRWGVPALAIACAAGALAAVDLTGAPAVAPTSYAAASTPLLVLALTAGLGLILAGAVLWLVRPGLPAVLAVGAGCAWSADDWVGRASAPDLVRSLAMMASPFLLALLVHLVLRWPGGRTGGPWARTAIGLAYAIATLVAVGQALLRDPLFDRYCWRTCGGNVFLARADVEAAQALHALRLWSWVLLAVPVVAGCLWSLRRVSRPARATRAGVVISGAMAIAAEASYAGLLLLVPQEVPTRGLFAAVFALRAAALTLLAAGLAWAALRTVRTRWSVRRLAQQLLEAPAPGTLRDVLSRSVGDDRIEVAYWLDGPQRYVDAEGHPTDPRPGAHQSVTALVRHGGQLAVVVHDRSLAQTHDLQRELGAAARLAVDNERLRAEGLFRLTDLRASQARVVARADATRRHLERDLHDGAQQRLLAVSSELRLALLDARRTGSPDLAALLEQAGGQAADALTELRELAHGIFPAILTDAGLGPALSTLAVGAPLPVDVLSVTAGRCGPAAESAAYLVVVDGIADAVRRSATYVSVHVELEASDLVVQLEDDGGDRDAGRLVHLEDRVAALGGRLSTQGPVLRAEIPCG